MLAHSGVAQRWSEGNYIFRRSSAVEQLTVNQLVAGSNPAAGASEFKTLFLRVLNLL